MHKKLKPSKIGLKVHNPATKLFLSEDGETVMLTTYWRRRLSCGDVIEVEDDKKKNELKKQNHKKNTDKMEVGHE